jgi:integrase
LIAFVFKRGAKFSAKIRMPWETATRVVALETTDRREARRVLDENVKERFMEHRGELTPRVMRETGEKPLKELLAAYLSELRGNGLAENTLAKYESNLATVFAACGWSSYNVVTARSFVEWRRRSKLAPKSLNDMLANARTFFRWLVRNRLARENPLDVVDRDRRQVERCRRALTREEQSRLLAAASRFRSVVYLLILETGMRRNELASVRVADFVFDTPSPFVRLPASITKNRKEAAMRLRPHVAAAVRSVIPVNACPANINDCP